MNPSDRARPDAVVVGAGIAGLTAAALLAKQGLEVELLEAHHQSGGCAGTFRRGPYVFDVGATQVAGLEQGDGTPAGIHARLFRHLGVAPPAAVPLDPGCVVDLADGREPVSIWRDPEHWRQERLRQFPGSERFWDLCDALHRANWAFASRDPVLPPRSWWDLGQLLGALGAGTLASGLLTTATIADLLRLTGCGDDRRLRRFLDLQLRLYSQEPADRTAALYGATVLAMVQEPLGLWHLEGSMQALSEALEGALARHGGRLRLRHRVERLQPPERPGGEWRIAGRRGTGPPGARNPAGEAFHLSAPEVVVSLPPQTLPALLGDALPSGYRRRLEALGEPSGALVFYGAVDRHRLPPGCPSHLQLEAPDPGSLFVSVSQEGDGRAPAGRATVIASVFTPARPWFGGDEAAYQDRKQRAMAAIQGGLERLLGVGPADWLHGELATPRGFAGWTGRPWGYVGGLGQHPSRFGPFGLASRTPLTGLWLCGDAIHPGEGTAGVSLSALMACRQLLAGRGVDLRP
ncbi:C-3',4' desaturase CrtD [Cyanobium sp. Copco_Reservoir_LC18]|uniref:C-3',4' desaturase CrtD n=1 Tax=Cyanobium sp. Copco_Reservoir_LC18 TaxID=1328305 RepID=UPI00135C45CA|nr:C-3',4' desaturase CrtD [Cyanobium sp. Copco_Reservoir_LC18]KAF0652194.1 C-3',4' desaturase CrtD [Cyanobium sp. Copco_Reservoir_LC18]